MLSGFAMSLSEEELWMAGRLRVGLKDICGKLFENLYRCVIAAIMQDTLEAEDDEIDVETDSISERFLNSMSFMKIRHSGLTK